MKYNHTLSIDLIHFLFSCLWQTKERNALISSLSFKESCFYRITFHFCFTPDSQANEWKQYNDTQIHYLLKILWNIPYVRKPKVNNQDILTLLMATVLLHTRTPAENSADIPSLMRTCLKSDNLGSFMKTALCPGTCYVKAAISKLFYSVVFSVKYQLFCLI